MRLAAKVTPRSPESSALDSVGWLKRAPADYQAFLARFGGSSLDELQWGLVPPGELSALEEQFRGTRQAPTSFPFAYQDGDYLVFDLAGDVARVVCWPHERQQGEPVADGFTAWLSQQLDDDDALDADDVAYAKKQKTWLAGYAPFAASPFGQAVAERLRSPRSSWLSKVFGASPKEGMLREVLLDLHLQYTFRPKVVERDGVAYRGLLHFKDDAVGCWRCGVFNVVTATQCATCGEALLLQTYADSKALARDELPNEAPFAEWVAAHLDLDAPKPTVVKMSPVSDLPTWARLTAFGGTRDPRVVPAQTDTW